jgi:hypothetical protein
MTPQPDDMEKDWKKKIIDGIWYICCYAQGVKDADLMRYAKHSSIRIIELINRERSLALKEGEESKWGKIIATLEHMKEQVPDMTLKERKTGWYLSGYYRAIKDAIDSLK